MVEPELRTQQPYPVIGRGSKTSFLSHTHTQSGFNESIPEGFARVADEGWNVCSGAQIPKTV